MTSERMPGDAEAEAAIRGMHELTGRPRPEHGIGDLVWYSPAVGRFPRPGRVAAHRADGDIDLLDEWSGELVRISPRQVAEV